MALGRMTVIPTVATAGKWGETGMFLMSRTRAFLFPSRFFFLLFLYMATFFCYKVIGH
mgnify:CR=1 FL=1